MNNIIINPQTHKPAPSKTASQILEELNLDLIPTELNVEQGMVDQALMAEDQPNVPPIENEEVESEESVKDSNREAPRQQEPSMTKFKDEFCEMKATITTLIDQNRMLVEIMKSGKSSSSDATKPTYMKNVPKPTTWDTKDKRNIEAIITEYETYCDAAGYNDDEVRVKIFGSFLKDDASIAFVACQGSRGEYLPWKDLKEWAIEAWRKPHQNLIDITFLGIMNGGTIKTCRDMPKSTSLSICNSIAERTRTST